MSNNKKLIYWNGMEWTWLSLSPVFYLCAHKQQAAIKFFFVHSCLRLLYITPHNTPCTKQSSVGVSLLLLLLFFCFWFFSAIRFVFDKTFLIGYSMVILQTNIFSVSRSNDEEKKKKQLNTHYYRNLKFLFVVKWKFICFKVLNLHWT